MSRDIRSFFPAKKPAKAVIVDDDDDIIPESPDVQIKNKKKESRKKRCLSDSDDEIFESKKKKAAHAQNSKTSLKRNKTPDKPELKEVKASDLFGSGPIKRTEPLVRKVKKNTETGIHSDEEFEKSLLEVDAIEEAAIKAAKTEPSSSKIQNNNTEHIAKAKSPKKQNGDSHSQEIKSNKSKEHIETKKGKDSHSEPKKEKVSHSEAKKENHSHTETRKEIHIETKKEKHSHTETRKEKTKEVESKKEKDSNSESKKDRRNKTDNESPRKRSEAISSVFFDKSRKTSPSKAKLEKEGSKDKKRDFSEFMESDVSVLDDTLDNHKSKRKRADRSLNESALTDEERHERKMQSAALYKNYLNRSGPKHLGAKEIPEGAPDCLANCAFLLTGVLDSFERDEVAAAITKYGGSIKNGISKKVTHVLAGDDAGPAKMAKAQELGIKILSEDEFLQMIRESTDRHRPSTSKESKKELKKEKSPTRKTPKKSQDRERKESQDKDKKSGKEKEVKLEIKESKNHVRNKSEEKNRNHEKNIEIKSETQPENKAKSSSATEIKGVSQPSRTPSAVTSNTMMWVDKYKPQTVKQIIGQHGDASNVKKLINWLTKWYVNRKAKLPKPSPWAKNDDGGFYKAALLSGPPGVGKTTTVSLVCKELGFDMVEFNASDTRSKTLIKEQIGELLTTNSLSAYAKGDTGKQAVTKKHVLVMDEVDGMAGNEDRGGLQELIALIKNTSVPIICMCNDRASQKMRSLVNYCYDLRFNRPRVEQIKSAMLSICCKEGIKIPPEALSQLIVASNQDVRQTLNLLSMWAVEPQLLQPDRLKKDAGSGKKDIKLGPWEAVRKVFSSEEHKTMSISDKSDLFFYDYSLAPLFVQENYLHVSPHCHKNEVLSRIAEAADSISWGDLVDARIRGNQAWNLLPVQAMFSSVMPGHVLSGHVSGQINFPAWLGHNSKRSKMQRLAQEIHAHTRLSTSGSKSSIFLDYAPHLRDAILNPLLKDKSDGIEKCLEVLESYHLLREDLDSLTELSLWPGQRNPMILIDSKIKAAMTRTYNKKALALPYAPGAVKKGRTRDTEQEDDDDGDEEEPDSDPENDALIKKKKKEEKPSSKGKPGTSKEKASTSKAGTSKDKPNARKKK